MTSIFKKLNITVELPKLKIRYQILLSLILLGVLMLLNNMPRGSYPSVVASEGIAKLNHISYVDNLEEGGRSARLNDTLLSGVEISVKRNAYLDMYLHRMYRMRFKENTELRADILPRSKTPGQTRLYLKQGEILAITGLNFYKSLIRIDTPNASVFVTGTSFIVDYDPDTESTWVAVARGEVVIKRKDVDEIVMVRDKQKAVIKKKEYAELPTAINKDDLARLKEIGSVGKLKVVLIFSQRGAKSRELFGPIMLYVQGRYPEAAHRMTVEALKIYNVASKEKNMKKHLQSLNLLHRVMEEAPDPNNDPQMLMFICTYYYKLGMYKEAAQSLGKILDKYPDSQWAAVAQCGIGILKEEKLNNIRGALAAYKSVIDKYPHSSEVLEAASGLERLKEKTGDVF